MRRTASPLRRRRRARPAPASGRPQIEALEERALLSTITASFDFGNGVTFANVPIASYSWGVTATPEPDETGGEAATPASAAPFTLTLDENSVDAVALADIARSKSVLEVDVTDDYGGATDQLVYKLTTVSFSSLATSATSGAGRPETTLDLAFRTIVEDHEVAKPGGPFSVASSTVWEVTTNQIEGQAKLPLSTTTEPSSVRMALTVDGTGGALQLDSITQSDTAPSSIGTGGAGGGAVKAAPGPFVVSSSVAGGVDPALLDNIARGGSFAGIDLHVNQDSTASAVDDHLGDTVLTSLQVSNSNGGQPETQAKLTWGTLRETYRQTNPDGTPNPTVPPVTISWDATTNLIDGAITPFPAPAGLSEPLELFDPATTGGLPVESASFSATATLNPGSPGGGAGRSVASPGPLVVKVAGSSADAGLLATLADGKLDSEFDLVVTPASPAGAVVTYALTDVQITSFSTSFAADGTATTTFELAWQKVTEDYQATNPDGSTSNVQTTWNAKVNTIDGAAIELPTPASPPALGLTIPGLTGELAVQSVSFGATGGTEVDGTGGTGAGVSKPLPGQFMITVDGSVADPGLLAELAKTGTLTELDVHALDASGQEYLTYKIERAVIVSLDTSFAPDGTFATLISLDWSTLEEQESSTNPDGSLGASSSVTWDAGLNTVDGDAIQLPTPASPPALGLTIPDRTGELTVESFSFGATGGTQTGSATGGAGVNAVPGQFTVTVDGSVADTGLLTELVKGGFVAEVDLHALGAFGGEYLTDKLTEVRIASIATDLSPGGVPTTTLTLSWATLEEQESSTSPDGSLGRPSTVTWDAKVNTIEGSLNELPTPASPPPLGLTIPGHTGELTVESFSFGATGGKVSGGSGGGAGVSKAVPGQFTVTVDGSIADPGLLAALVKGTQIAEVDLHLLTTGAVPQEYLTEKLTGVRITSLTTSLSSGGRPVTTISLGWENLEEDYHPTSSTDPLGPAAVVTWDAVENKAAVTVDEIGSVHFSETGFALNRKTGHFLQTVTITNTSNDAINGSLVLDGLTNATLVGASGTNPTIGAPGSPFVGLTVDIGQTITMTLEFVDPTQKAITYTPRLLVNA